MFQKIYLSYDNHLFDELLNSAKLENSQSGKPRSAAIIALPSDDQSIPIVRSTTIYHHPVQRFTDIHHDIIKNINNSLGSNYRFNNGMLELYDHRYRTMAYHSDQALDLNEDSHIAIFSCYETLPSSDDELRTLVIKNKINKDVHHVVMDHHSVILFDVHTNNQYWHKIVLKSNKNNKWLGLTLRLSKTFVKHVGNDICMADGTPLQLATEQEITQFYKLRSMENQNTDFIYPPINYTISPSDLLEILC